MTIPRPKMNKPKHRNSSRNVIIPTKFYSKIIGQEIKYSVLLPQEYLSESTAKYGVVFLLHGWGGNQNSWGPSGLNIQTIVDTQTNNGSVRPIDLHHAGRFQLLFL